MKKLALTLLLLAAQADAATKWTDLSGLGAGLADGSSAANACAGLSDPDCIGANLPAGSLSYFCNTTNVGITVPVAGSATAQTTYSCACPGGTPGSIAAISGTAGILANKQYTRVGDSCNAKYVGGTAIQINADDVVIGAAYAYESQDGVVLTTPQVRARITLDGTRAQYNTRNGLRWFTNSATTNTLTDFTARDGTFSNNANSGIYFACDVAAANCSLVRPTFERNDVGYNGNTNFVIQQCYPGPTCADVVTNASANTTSARITENNIHHSTAGGGGAFYGLINSVIRENDCSDNFGPIGGLDVFNSLNLLVADNHCNRNATNSIDANGILVDYGNQFVWVLRNEASFNKGLANVDNSGVGIMVLRGTDVYLQGNYGRGNKTGFYFSGNAFAEARIFAQGNTFVDNLKWGAYFDSTQDASSTTLTNNILGGADTGIYAEAGGSAQTENFNVFNFPTRRNYNGVGWTDGANSQLTDPGLNSRFRISELSLCNAASPLGSGTYGDGRRWEDKPTFGAFACE